MLGEATTKSDQSDQAWVGIVGGRVLPIHRFDGNVTAEAYLSMLKDVVWPAVKRKKDLRFQTDGARVYATYDVLDFLQKKLMDELFLIV